MEERECLCTVLNCHMFRIGTSEVLDENDPIKSNWQPVQGICHWKLNYCIAYLCQTAIYYRVKQR